jgi:hypothetical protein
MSSQASDLAVRGSARYQCAIDGAIAVGDEHSKLVKADKSAPGAGGPVSVRMVDLSHGGAGLRSPLFLPRLCRLSLTLTLPGSIDPITLGVRIHRVTMMDRSPSYYLGTGFEGLTPEQSEAVSLVVAQLKAAGAKLVPELPRG